MRAFVNNPAKIEDRGKICEEKKIFSNKISTDSDEPKNLLHQLLIFMEKK